MGSHFGLENKGNNFKTCKDRIRYLKLDISHYLNKWQSSSSTNTISYEDGLSRLIEKSPWKRQAIKQFLIKHKLKEYKCQKCQNIGIWEGNKLSLQLEHINGISNDNRLDNLTFLCPNCHSQTATYAGKKLKQNTVIQLSDKSKIVISAFKRRKYLRPPKEELEENLKTQPIYKIAEKYHVKSDNTIRKWLKFYGIDYKILSPFTQKRGLCSRNLVKVDSKSET